MSGKDTDSLIQDLHAKYAKSNPYIDMFQQCFEEDVFPGSLNCLVENVGLFARGSGEDTDSLVQDMHAKYAMSNAYIYMFIEQIMVGQTKLQNYNSLHICRVRSGQSLYVNFVKGTVLDET